MNDDRTKSPRRQILPCSGAGVLKAGAIEMDLARRRVWVGNQPVKLARKELEMLRLLLEAKGAVIHRESLLKKIWCYDGHPRNAARTVDVHILRLRNKLGPEGRRILTVRNVGYRFDICPEWIMFGV